MLGQKQWVIPPTANFVSGGMSQFLLHSLPPGRIVGFLLQMKVDVTQAAVIPAPAIPGSMLFRLFDQIRLDDRVRTTGRGLFFLDWFMQGKTPTHPYPVPIGAVAPAVYSRLIDLWLPFADYGQESPLDTALNPDVVRSKTLDVNWANVAAIFSADTTVAATQLRLVAYMEKAKPDEFASDQEINFTDWNQQTAQIAGSGGVTHLFTYAEDSDSLTDALYATFTVTIDGETMTPQIFTTELIGLWNQARAHGVETFAPGVVAGPVLPQGGEQIFNQPGPAAAAGPGVTMPWIPIIFPPGDARGYSLTHVPIAGNMVRIDFTGATTAIRLAMRKVRLNSEAGLTEKVRTVGFADPGARRKGVKVSGSGRLNSRALAVLPQTIETSREERLARGDVG